MTLIASGLIRRVGLAVNSLIRGESPAPSLCDFYEFKSTNSDSLQLGVPMTSGNVKVWLASTSSDAGLNPLILAGAQGAFVPSTDIATDPQWNAYEVDLLPSTGAVYDFSDGAYVTVPSVDAAEFKAIVQKVSTSGKIINGSSASILSTTGDDLMVTASSIGSTWAGAITSIAEGDYYTLRVVDLGASFELFINDVSQGTRANAGVLNINRISVNYGAVIKDVEINGGAVYNFPINDGWGANPVIANLGTGADGVMVNGAEAGWITTGDVLSDIVDATFNGRVAYAKDDVWFNVDMGAPQTFFNVVFNSDNVVFNSDNVFYEV